MLDKNVYQPLDLSAAEWQLLQQVATYSDPFSAEDLLLSQGKEQPTDHATSVFYRHFHRLKHCGYITVVPAEADRPDSQPAALYKLSAEGEIATQPKERYASVLRFNDTRR